MSSHDGASCWICLDDGPDELGKPIVRDCSCRGSMGYCHLSCIIKFAEEKSKAIVDEAARRGGNINRQWENCPNCKQIYQNELRYDLSTAYVLYSERENKSHDGTGKFAYYNSRHRVMMALMSKVTTIESMLNQGNYTENQCSRMRAEGGACANKVLSIVESVMKVYKRHQMSKWVHMPKSSTEYQIYYCVRGSHEQGALSNLGIFAANEGTEEGRKSSIRYHEKAKAIAILLGKEQDVQSMEKNILSTRGMYDDGSAQLEHLRGFYQNRLQLFGESSCQTLQCGLNLVGGLGRAYNHIEAQRLVAKLVSISRQVHGLEHRVTREANDLLEAIQLRLVGSICKPEDVLHVLHYDEDEMCYTVLGPIKCPRNREDERVMKIPVELVVPKLGCPVVCRGLQKASLNGKMGDVRSMSRDDKSQLGIRLAVHFEDQSLKPALVKLENLRVVRDLPEKSRTG